MHEARPEVVRCQLVKVCRQISRESDTFVPVPVDTTTPGKLTLRSRAIPTSAKASTASTFKFRLPLAPAVRVGSRVGPTKRWSPHPYLLADKDPSRRTAMAEESPPEPLPPLPLFSPRPAPSTLPPALALPRSTRLWMKAHSSAVYCTYSSKTSSIPQKACFSCRRRISRAACFRCHRGHNHRYRRGHHCYHQRCLQWRF